MSDPPRYPVDSSGASRETRRASLDRRADDYTGGAGYARAGGRDPRDRATGVLAFLVIGAVVLMLALALYFVLAGRDQVAEVGAGVRLPIPESPLPLPPEAPRLPSPPDLPRPPV